MSLTNLLNTARDALAAQTYGLNVAGGNVANANTPGYVRRDAILETTNIGTQTTGSVDVAGLRRATDQYLNQRTYDASGQSSSAGERDQELASIEALVSGAANGGLGDAMSQLFSSFSALAANPNDTTVRQTVLSAASNFAQRANDLGNSISQQRADVMKEAQSVADEVNQHASALARLNQQIALALNAGQDAADLQDRRDQELAALSQLVDTRAFTNQAGQMVVQVSGTTLVEGQVARTISVDLDGNDRMRILATTPGSTPKDVTAFLSGGRLAGLRDARDTDLKQVGDRLDQFVFDVATAVNGQHAAGVGLDGNGGRPLFSISPAAQAAARAISVDSSIAGHPEFVAASADAGALPGGSDNAVALSRLSTFTFASGGRTGAEAFGDLVGDIASRKAQSADVFGLKKAMEDQVTQLKESQSGVSLDEEMVSLTKFQRAFEAASKVLQTADQLMQELLDRIGR
ncbi:MAG TPA: flagellar hook-associated protein FlgK [Polyangiaceae bacterium]|nr:flagellar hook-associated protein FlgK [Polyangiaceae bacterium]